MIIPTLNEESNLRSLLPQTLAQADEVVVSDGGSKDATIASARELGARVIEGAAGRGNQLNRGARAAQGEILLFLHADTRLPEGWCAAVRETIAGGASGGAFLLGFDTDRRLLRLGAGLINLRTRLTQIPLGDHAQFVTREAFEELGGFRDWPILEDLEFAKRLKRRGEPMVILPARVVTAARRFTEQGVVRTVVNNWWIWLSFAAGASPHRLARRYRPTR